MGCKNIQLSGSLCPNLSDQITKGFYCGHLQTKIKQNILETNSTLISANKLCITMFCFISLGNAFYHSTIEPYLVSLVNMVMGPLILLILVFSLFFTSLFSQTWGKCIFCQVCFFHLHKIVKLLHHPAALLEILYISY